MYLVRTKTKHIDSARLIEDYTDAMAFAMDHVGDHNEADGCSTKPSVRTFPTHSYMERHTSFGRRQAWVLKPTVTGGVIYNLNGA